MNTTMNTKGTAHGFGRTASLLAVVALIAVVGILAVALYVSAPRPTAAPGVGNSAAVNIPLDQHDRHLSDAIASTAANALLEQRRGEWAAPAASNTQNAFVEQRRGEWGAGTAVVISEKRFPGKEKDDLGIGLPSYANAGAQDAYLQQRRGEWGVR